MGSIGHSRTVDSVNRAARNWPVCYELIYLLYVQWRLDSWDMLVDVPLQRLDIYGLSDCTCHRGMAVSRECYILVLLCWTWSRSWRSKAEVAVGEDSRGARGETSATATESSASRRNAVSHRIHNRTSIARNGRHACRDIYVESAFDERRARYT